MRVPICVSGAFAFVLLSVVSGCGDKGRSNKAEEESPLKPIATFYAQYMSQHQGQPPRDEVEFKTFLKEPKVADRLKLEFQVTDVDKLLISPRDNKPFVIYYTARSKNTGPGGAPLVAYEQEGLAGKRMVASALGAVAEVDDAAFRKMVPDAK